MGVGGEKRLRDFCIGGSVEERSWPQLLQMILTELQPFIKVEDGSIECIHFVEELKGLLYNIEGNGNYGESFVSAVEEAFAQFFARNQVL